MQCDANVGVAVHNPMRCYSHLAIASQDHQSAIISSPPTSVTYTCPTGQVCCSSTTCGLSGVAPRRIGIVTYSVPHTGHLVFLSSGCLGKSSINYCSSTRASRLRFWPSMSRAPARRRSIAGALGARRTRVTRAAAWAGSSPSGNSAITESTSPSLRAR